jgi:hypothetical protein
VIRLPASALIGGEELPVAVNPGAKFAITGTAVDIYAALNSDAAGYAAKVLKNGEVLHTLRLTSPDSTNEVVALSLAGNDVYTAGFGTSGSAGSEITYGRVWKNNELLFSGEVKTEFQALAISGSDVYAGGFDYSGDTRIAKIWKRDGAGTVISYVLPEGTRINGVAVAGADVYAAGYEKPAGGKQVAKIWKNNTVLHTLTDGTYDALPFGVAVTGTDVYTAGWEENAAGKSVAKIWKNATELYVYPGSSGTNTGAYTLALSGSDVYVGGYNAADAVVWKNNTLLYNPGAGEIYSIAVLGDTVYAGGFADTGSGSAAKIWKNNEAIYTAPAGSDETWICGLAVKARN